MLWPKPDLPDWLLYLHHMCEMHSPRIFYMREREREREKERERVRKKERERERERESE